ncbi:hypothetical protein U1Q18_018311 [Sarracenia purpurea var. burkii]
MITFKDIYANLLNFKTLHTLTEVRTLNRRYRGKNNNTTGGHHTSGELFRRGFPAMETSNLRQMAMYIRVKRSKTTYFLQCDPTETILDIKQKLHALIDQPVNDQRLILMATGDVLDDLKSLADQKVENDAVVALTLRKDDNEFEDVNIVRPNDFYQSRDADGTSSW